MIKARGINSERKSEPRRRFEAVTQFFLATPATLLEAIVLAFAFRMGNSGDVERWWGGGGSSAWVTDYPVQNSTQASACWRSAIASSRVASVKDVGECGLAD